MKIIIQTRWEENGLVQYVTLYKELTNIEDNNVSKISFELGDERLELIKNASGWGFHNSNMNTFVRSHNSDN